MRTTRDVRVISVARNRGRDGVDPAASHPPLIIRIIIKIVHRIIRGIKILSLLLGLRKRFWM